MLSELIEGMVYQAANNLHWGGKRWEYPGVAEAAFQYAVAYQVKQRKAPTHSRFAIPQEQDGNQSSYGT